MPKKKSSRKTATAPKAPVAPVKAAVAKAGVSVDAVAKKAERRAARKSYFMNCVYWLAIASAVATGCWMISRNGAATTAPVAEDAAEVRANTPANVAAAARLADSGKSKLLDGDAVGALNDFSAAIEQNPAAEYFVYRGEILMQGENFAAAVADFGAALRIDAKSVAAYYDRALANIRLEKLSDAKADLDKAVANWNEDSPISEHDVFAKRAQVSLWLRDWRASEADWTQAIAKTSGESDWNDFAGRAECRTNMGDFQEAANDYVSAVTIISDRIQKTPDDTTRANMSRQAMGYFEKSGALRIKLDQHDLALQDLQAAHTLAIALDDIENKNRLQILISSLM
ncbi:MAG: hypothetical protein LBL46_03815 [Rickettsiales bacterium]|jgi:tetratricopeptide (TPR) repeat protein|nr:hypothetical protein [Rickettsiales bacterium]